MSEIDRRTFLALGGLALAGMAVGCGRGAPERRTLRQIGEGLQGRTAVDMAQGDIDVLARPDARISFGLFERSTRKRLTGGRVRVWYALDVDEVARGPVEATYHGEGLGDKGVYVARLDLDRTGNWIVIAEGRPANATADVAGNAAYSAVNAVSGPAPGARAVSVATPTVDDHRGVEPYCTRVDRLGNPAPCSLHRLSLDVALANGRPTVFNIGTPKFCTSQTCGPVLEVIQTVASEFPGRVNFIHAEVYRDDKFDTIQRQILAPAAAAWGLREEPVTYWIRPDNTIVERIVGPTDVAEVRQLTLALAG